MVAKVKKHPSEYDAILSIQNGTDEDDDEVSDEALLNPNGKTNDEAKFASLRILPLPEEEDSERVPLHEEITPADMSTTFLEDLRHLTPGSMPQSVLVGATIGVFCGLVAYIYYFTLEALLELLWHTLPETILEPHLAPSLHWLWIPLLGYTMALGVGLSVRYLGEPGDLSYTVQCVHQKAYIGMDHVAPMLCASQFSILGGGSLGPEAPLVAICASFSGYISRKVFRQTRMNIIRKHTLMGMACALAAFFGVPLGGSLFALEINNRFGIEYYEHTMEAIFSGTVCLCVFRGLTRLDIGAIWTISSSESNHLGAAHPKDVAIGAAVGLLGAGVAALFSMFHQRLVMPQFKKHHLISNRAAVPRALVGATVVIVIGILVPQTMFWGESEFQTIATASPAENLPHVFPTTGLMSFEMNGFWSAMLVGCAKMVAISFTVAGGYRGGFIFPFFAAGAAFGKALTFVLPSLSPTIATLSFAAGINVAITRTALATTLILAALAGEQNAITPVLAASIVSLFVTSYMPFIRSQVKRADIGQLDTSTTTSLLSKVDGNYGTISQQSSTA